MSKRRFAATNDSKTLGKHRYGVVGGLGVVAGADLLLKMIGATQRRPDMRDVDIAFEQRHFDSGPSIADENYNPGRRKFYVYNTLKDMEARGIDTALVPCFVSHTFLSEITPELDMRVISLFDALREWLAREHPALQTIGVLTSTYVQKSAIFERQLGSRYQIVYPHPAVQSDKLMRAIYGPSGVRAGHHGGECVELLAEACHCLVASGAQIIVPGLTEVSVLIDSLRPLLAVPVVDSNLVYAEYALGCEAAPPVREFKLGVVGGVGPAATVDFMHKVVRLTGAARDQDHIKMMVEQNPQIPDRTANLIGSGADPTISLLATCKQLEAGGANAVAIPCNTAHAFVDRIQPYLEIPIVNMLSEVVQHIRSQMPAVGRVGLLATSGTVSSGVYRDVAEAAGLRLLVPDDAVQDLVMAAIYGERGVKAGFTSGVCSDHLATAIDHLASKGAEVIILGCTELPLIAIDVAVRRSIVLLDPTEILAARCVALAGASTVEVRR
ncbi:MAG: aspartate racemase [Candidatus Accumulibacter regalis]|uniref:amino acid racemase n=1 Tax=unclassified Candidatus Accumulibacter TaxID=2619054 RepID=UPI0012C5F073|nr:MULTISPECIES: amino acid racemase [unclassified Candidatus Accumulibacter]MQM33483.1 aspartate racemase [Candidatus Accumulibacter phosphatis]